MLLDKIRIFLLLKGCSISQMIRLMGNFPICYLKATDSGESALYPIIDTIFTRSDILTLREV